jgi:hypothetical protein
LLINTKASYKQLLGKNQFCLLVEGLLCTSGEDDCTIEIDQLVSIAALGLIAIPFGNPKSTDRAIILELSFAI